MNADDAPPGYAPVVRVITRLRDPEAVPTTAQFLEAADAGAVAEATQTAFELVPLPTPARPIDAPVRPPAAVRPATASAPRHAPRRRVLVLSGVLAATMLLGLATAGALPGPMQDAASSFLDRIGVHVPDGGDTSPAVDSGTPDVAHTGAGGAANGNRGAATNGSAGANGATPAVPATPAIPADGGTATPAVPATPAAPNTPTESSLPQRPTTPTSRP